MSPYPFCGRLYNNVCTVLYGCTQIPAGSESIINHQGYRVTRRQSGECLKIRNVKAGVADCLKINGLCVVID